MSTYHNTAAQIEARTNECIERADPALETLQGLAGRYDGSEEHARKVGAIRHEMRRSVFRLIVAGKMKTGKSTFLNALLGRQANGSKNGAGHGSPLPSNDLPTTAILTHIEYDDEPSVRVVYKERFHESLGPSADWSFEQYLRDSRVRPTDAENRRFFEPIEEFQMKYPAELCRAGIRISDSPGGDDIAERDMITLEAATVMDAAIIMFRTDSLVGQSEREFVQELMATGLKRMFLVVNLWNGRELDRELQATTWDRVVTMMQGGPAYEGQNLSEANIFFVDAEKARRGKMENDPYLIEESGMAFFEEKLRLFLERDRRSVHINRFVDRARSEQARLVCELERQAAVLHEKTGTLSQKREAIERAIQELEEKVSHVPRVIQDFEGRAQQSVLVSWDMLINRLASELYEGGALHAEIMALDIPSLRPSGWVASLKSRTLAPFQREKLFKEVAGLALALIEGRIKAWQRGESDNGYPQAMRVEMDRMLQELERVAGGIQRNVDDIQLELTGGMSVAAGSYNTNAPAWHGRIVGTAFGVLVGQPDMVLSAAGGGWGGLGRDMLGRFGAAMVLIYLGTPLAVTLPLIAVSGFLLNLVWGTNSLANDIKKSVLAYLLHGDPKDNGRGSLRSGLEARREEIATNVSREFRKVNDAVCEEVEIGQRDEIHSVREQLRLNELNAVERAQVLEVVCQDLGILRGLDKPLNDVLTLAKQL